MIANPLTRARSLFDNYPRQFWVIFWGVLINTAGAGLVWPFMTIYLRQRLEVPLTTVTLGSGRRHGPGAGRGADRRGGPGGDVGRRAGGGINRLGGVRLVGGEA